MTDDDRRHQRRHTCLVEVHALHGERFFCGRAHNLSSSGAFVECPESPPLGESVHLLFDLPPRLYRIVGRVVSLRQGAPQGFAIGFSTEEPKVLAVARALSGEAREIMRRPVLRAHLRLPCEVRLRCATGERTFETTARDISPGGAFLVTPERCTLGSFVVARFQRPSGEPHDAPAIVRWSREPHGERRPGGLGIAFLRDEEPLAREIRGELAREP